MAFATLHENLVKNYEIIDFAGQSFADLDKFITESQPILCTSSAKNFNTESVLWFFDSELLSEHIKSNPINAYMEIAVEYFVNGSAPSYEYSVTLNYDFAFKNKIIETVSGQEKNIKVTQDNNNQVRTATIRVHADTLPNNSILASENFGFVLNAYCINPFEQNIDITINTIKLSLYSSTDGSYLVIYNDIIKRFAEENDEINLGSIYPNSKLNGALRIYNFGSQKLYVAKDTVLSDSSNFFLKPKSDNNDIIIDYKNFINIPYEYFGSAENSSYYATFSLQSTANNTNSPIIFFAYLFNTTSFTTGKLEVFYGKQQLQSADPISLLTIPQNVSTKSNISLKNVGVANLIITEIDFEGMVYAADSVSFAGIVIPPNEERNIEFLVNNQIIGNASGKIIVKTTDPLQSIFTINPYAQITESAKLIIKEGVEINFAVDDLENGKTINLGSLQKNRISRKFYNLRNAGFHADILIDSITTSNGNSFLSDLPFLPFLLKKNNENSFTFSLIFNTSTGVTNDTELLINYSKVS